MPISQVRCNPDTAVGECVWLFRCFFCVWNHQSGQICLPDSAVGECVCVFFACLLVLFEVRTNLVKYDHVTDVECVCNFVCIYFVFVLKCIFRFVLSIVLRGRCAVLF